MEGVWQLGEPIATQIKICERVKAAELRWYARFKTIATQIDVLKLAEQAERRRHLAHQQVGLVKGTGVVCERAVQT